MGKTGVNHLELEVIREYLADPDNIIHCNYARNGITVDNYNQTAAASGWMYCYVYRLANQSTPLPSGKDLDTLVKETLAGKYGNGDQRKAALGNQYEAVMAVINGKATAPKNVDQLAQEVIQGKHGNGEDRKRSLGLTTTQSKNVSPNCSKNSPLSRLRFKR